MKWFLFPLGSVLLILAIVILGGDICLSDGCCYKTHEEIQRAENGLLWLSRLWLSLLALTSFLLIKQFHFWYQERNRDE